MNAQIIRAAIIGTAAALTLSVYSAPAFAGPGRDSRHDALGATIDSAIRAGGPFFTPAEQRVINSKCGYAPGEWDGYDIDISNGVFHCKNGKTVDDAEMRALVEAAKPRIHARVSAAMARPDVQSAIHAVAETAAREAIAKLHRHHDAD